ncbi:MAG: N-acetyltransferase family protein [Rhodospirillaceae bacterium]|nr:N-acetyltransferase family protein [Rhodospirillaceae bacterium]
MIDPTKTETITIRDANAKDMEAVQAIYAPHVLDGLASFEEVPPAVAEMDRRLSAIQDSGFPFRVAEIDGKILGFAYAGPYRTRPAYRYMVENSIYVDLGSTGQGIGKKLLEDLIDICSEKGLRQMIAVIGDSDNKPSINLHSRLGFTHIGTIRAAGFKHGRWVDSVIMQLALGPGDGSLP